jgi:hypothetical protein
MKASKYVLAPIIYLFFGAFLLTTPACYDMFMTPADDPSPRVIAPKVAILAAPCYREGEALTVYNPNNPDLNFYDTEAYRVQWLERGVVQFEGATTPCVCGKTYRVVVTRLEDDISASVIYTTIDCAGPVDK